MCSGTGGGANVKGGIPSISDFLVRGVGGERPARAAEFRSNHGVALECAPRTCKCFGDTERRWRVRHNRERESGAWLLINAAGEPLIATLENPPEKPAPVVNPGSTHAGTGINMNASEPLRCLSPQRLEWRLGAGRQFLFKTIHHHR